MFEQKLPPSQSSPSPFRDENLIEKHQSFSLEKKKIRNDPSYTLSHMEERWARNTRHVHQLNYAHKQTLRCLLIASPLRKLFGGGPPWWIIPFGIEFHVSRIYIYISAQTRETTVALQPTNSSLRERPWKQERARQVLTY